MRLVGLIKNKFVTMHGHMNVKFLTHVGAYVPDFTVLKFITL